MPKSQTKRRWSVAFKLQVLSKMDEAVSVTLLAEEIGIDRERLYIWRRKYRSGGAGALSTLGRPSNLSRLTEAPSAQPSADGIEAKQRRIEELERKIGQQLCLDAPIRSQRGLKLTQDQTLPRVIRSDKDSYPVRRNN